MQPRKQKIPLTREGRLWALISLAMLVTALLKGINLVTLLACWMLVLVALNYWWASRQLRRARAVRVLADSAFARTPCLVQLRVRNLSDKPVFGLGALDPLAENSRAGFIPRLAPNSAESLNYRLVFPRRGRQTSSDLELTCGYPLGLVSLRHEIVAEEDIIVFPQLGSLHKGLLRHFLTRHSPSLGQAQTFPRRHPGAQTEFHGLRTFRAGDSPRWIHWRTTARRGELMVREFEDMPEEHLVLVVDVQERATGHDRELHLIERALSFAATICWEWCRQKGDHMVLALAGPKPVIVGGITGLPLALTMLELLALASTETAAETESFLDKLVEAELPKGPMLVVSVHETGLAGAVSQALNRPVAQINVEHAEESEFFELS